MKDYKDDHKIYENVGHHLLTFHGTVFDTNHRCALLVTGIVPVTGSHTTGMCLVMGVLRVTSGVFQPVTDRAIHTCECICVLICRRCVEDNRVKKSSKHIQ